MKRLAVRLFIASAMTVAVLPVLTSPVSAAGELGLSNDGVHWGSGLAHPLFESSFRWVPGDVQTKSFYVRNQSGQRADLVIDILGSRVDSLMETGGLAVSARGGGGQWQAITTPGRHRLLQQVKVASGHKQLIDVTVAFNSASTNASQLRQLDLRLLVRLSQDPTETGVNSPHLSGALPDTGAGRFGWLVAFAAGTMALGLVLVSRRRKEI